MVMFWRMFHLTGVATAGRANSVMNACSILDASTGPATFPGSATARGTGGACCVIKVWQRLFFLSPTQEAGRVPALILHIPSSYSVWWVTSEKEVQHKCLLKRQHINVQNTAIVMLLAWETSSLLLGSVVGTVEEWEHLLDLRRLETRIHFCYLKVQWRHIQLKGLQF